MHIPLDNPFFNGDYPIHQPKSKWRWMKMGFLLVFGLLIGVVTTLMVVKSWPVMTHATEVMDKADVWFNLLWKGLCNDTKILPTNDCKILQP